MTWATPDNYRPGDRDRLLDNHNAVMDRVSAAAGLPRVPQSREVFEAELAEVDRAVWGIGPRRSTWVPPRG